MQLDFRQGVIRYSNPNGQQDFLNVEPTGAVSLNATNAPVVMTAIHGQSNYLITLDSSTTNAWPGPFETNVEYWLYVKINPVTGVQTFGSTGIKPQTGSSFPPPGTFEADDLVFYRTDLKQIFISVGGHFVKTILVFTCILNGFNVFPVGTGTGSLTFAGTQVGETGSSLAGQILTDSTGKPITLNSGELFNTESQLYIDNSQINTVKLDSSVYTIEAAEPIPARHVITLDTDGKAVIATYSDVSDKIIAMSMEDLNTGEVGAISFQGIISNELWDWDTSLTSLWVSDTGELIPEDLFITERHSHNKKSPPVARVINKTTIIFDQGLGGIGEPGPVGTITNLQPATVFSSGVSKLSTTPVDATDPIVVSDTDPRLIDSRTPTPHIHPASQITTTPYGELVSTDAEQTFRELEDNKLSLSGGSINGVLKVSQSPLTGDEVATKQYVDGLVNGLIWIDPVNAINLIGNTVLTPPAVPELADSYVLPAGVLTGAWAAFNEGSVVCWDGASWVNLGNISLLSNKRFGVAFDTITVPSGAFSGQSNNIAVYDSVLLTWSFVVPFSNNALFVNNQFAYHAYHQFAFNDGSWVEMNNGHAAVELATTELTDVSQSTPNDGDVLQFNSTSLKYEPGAPAAPSAPSGSPYDYVPATNRSCNGNNPGLWTLQGGDVNSTSFFMTHNGYSSDFVLLPATTWSVGFRPTDLAISLSNIGSSNDPITVYLYDTDGNTIGVSTPTNVVIPSNDTVTFNIPITFGTADLHRIYITGMVFAQMRVDCINFTPVVPPLIVISEPPASGGGF